jgi:hypothetical protein
LLRLSPIDLSRATRCVARLLATLAGLGALGAAAENPVEKVVASRCVEADTAGACAVYGLSLLELIANPERFHGRRVSVRGYVRLEFEGNAIYLSKESYESRSTRDALWLDPPAKSPLAKPGTKWGPGYASVQGRFDAFDRGHMGMYSGAITDTTRIVLR